MPRCARVRSDWGGGRGTSPEDSESSPSTAMTSDGRVMSVSIRVGTDGGLESGQPQKLFQARPLRTFNLYDATPDGQLFLVNIPLEWTSALPITVVTNWTEKLKQ